MNFGFTTDGLIEHTLAKNFAKFVSVLGEVEDISILGHVRDAASKTVIASRHASFDNVVRRNTTYIDVTIQNVQWRRGIIGTIKVEILLFQF